MVGEAYMIRFLASFITGLFFIFGAISAQAQDYAKGLAAAQLGDFVTALKEWQPLAEQGDADAQNNLGFMYGILVADDNRTKIGAAKIRFLENAHVEIGGIQIGVPEFGPRQFRALKKSEKTNSVAEVAVLKVDGFQTHAAEIDAAQIGP